MNGGKLLKKLYSSNPTVSSAIEKAIRDWPFGYAEQTPIPLDNNSKDYWYIEIKDQGSHNDEHVVIDAYLHMRCGFSHFDLDSADMGVWLSSGSRFKKLVVQSKKRELPYELWQTLCSICKPHAKNDEEIQTVILTIVGKLITLSEVSLYMSIADHFPFDLILNTSLFDDDSFENYISLHCAFNSTTKTVV